MRCPANLILRSNSTALEGVIDVGKVTATSHVVVRNCSGGHPPGCCDVATAEGAPGGTQAVGLCGVNSRPFSVTITTTNATMVQRKNPLANGTSVPS